MSNGPKSAPGHYHFYLDSSAHQICTVQVEKDLGVTFDENLHFKTHILINCIAPGTVCKCSIPGPWYFPKPPLLFRLS